jgi:hypothetical protein
MNEPDSMGIKWEPSSGHPGARELYLETLDALHSMVPEGLLYILEGKCSRKMTSYTDAVAHVLHLFGVKCDCHCTSSTSSGAEAQRQYHASSGQQLAESNSSRPRLRCCRC